jgi:microcystin-dependent protein
MSDPLPVDGYIPDLTRTVTEMRTALENVRDSVFQSLGRAPKTTLTIATGSITPNRAVHRINTEGSASTDDLTNILSTNVPDGYWLVIEALDPSRVVTIKDSAGGAGQISTLDGNDLNLNDRGRVFLEYDDTGGVWNEVFVAKQAGMPAGLIVGSIAPYTTDQVWGLLGYGRVVAAATYPLLFAEVGNFYNVGGEGVGNFRLPDSRDIVPVGRGNMGGSARGLITATGTGNPGLDTTSLGATAGTDRRTNTSANTPSHSHTVGTLAVTGAVSPDPHGHAHDSNVARYSGSGQSRGTGSNTMSSNDNIIHTTSLTWSGSISGSTSSSGTGDAFPILQPSMVVNYLYTTGVAQ